MKEATKKWLEQAIKKATTKCFGESMKKAKKEKWLGKDMK